MEAFRNAQSELEGHVESNGVTLQVTDASAGAARASAETMAGNMMSQRDVVQVGLCTHIGGARKLYICLAGLYDG